MTKTSARRTTGSVAFLAAALMAVAVIAAGPANAQNAPIVYPSQGQSTEQQAMDEGECRNWAQQQTGFNPYQGAPTYTGSSGGGEVVGGAARGALIGVVGGAIAGDAGKGAAIGAGIGATAGLLRRHDRRQDDAAAQQQAAAQYNEGMANFNRAFATCMQGRGYAVN